MKNTHLEHPEDSILTGDLSVLDWFLAYGEASLKIDGAPAIVWAPIPLLVTLYQKCLQQSKIKINESHEDIDRNHPNPELAKFFMLVSTTFH